MSETKAGRKDDMRPTSVTVTTEPVKPSRETRSLTLKLRKPKPDKKVQWATDTVDNEHMGRRSSKCCCIYKKPRAFGESSTDSEDEHDESCSRAHCVRGHRRGLQRAPSGRPPTPFAAPSLPQQEHAPREP